MILCDAGIQHIITSWLVSCQNGIDYPMATGPTPIHSHSLGMVILFLRHTGHTSQRFFGHSVLQAFFLLLCCMLPSARSQSSSRWANTSSSTVRRARRLRSWGQTVRERTTWRRRLDWPCKRIPSVACCVCRWNKIPWWCQACGWAPHEWRRKVFLQRGIQRAVPQSFGGNPGKHQLQGLCGTVGSKGTFDDQNRKHEEILFFVNRHESCSIQLLHCWMFVEAGEMSCLLSLSLLFRKSWVMSHELCYELWVWVMSREAWAWVIIQVRM